MNKRQEKIIEIITQSKIDTQNELAEKLAEYGYEATQSTVSRDIKTLGLVKADDGGKSYYAPKSLRGAENKYESIFKASVLSVKSSGNLIVIKTIAGSANPACALLDTYFDNVLLGSVAGDDAIISVAENEYQAKKIVGRLLNLIK